MAERTIADKFQTLVVNLRTQNGDKVKARRGAVTRRLNQDFWDSYSETEHSRFIGSYGRGTEIRGASDVDLLFRLPPSVYSQYNSHSGNGQSALLQTFRNSIRKTYSSTDVGGDGQVVMVSAASVNQGLRFRCPC
jgi:tRNA nucleotidyltransferase (CCA-adding enzyme)